MTGLPNASFWRGKRVFVTGHTGFKGSWLSLFLTQLGAEVRGYALEPPTTPSLFVLARIERLLEHLVGDVRDLTALTAAMHGFAPDIVLHLAAQPLVRLSYDVPVDTFATNVMGTVNFLEAARRCPSAQVALVITSDKCYRNVEMMWGYREADAMGGDDPYSSSKGCAELVTHAYGKSFFTTAQGHKALGSVRAGNVIGGGDWAKDRLMTDIIAALLKGNRPIIRRPAAVRPWQHVLEPLSGYLLAAEHLWPHDSGGKNRRPLVDSWNFGPGSEDEVAVQKVAQRACELWGQTAGIELQEDPRNLHEAGLLRLDSTKARQELGWRPRWELETALGKLVHWYKQYQAGADMHAVTVEQIVSHQSQDSRRAAA